ncbi:hypothetical protein CRN39_02380 [Vibrio vulnificus]|nr:hypothetical protein CRN39_02380 [Vibrio vulnificus]
MLSFCKPQKSEHNKAFKSDSQRVAFLICVGLSDYDALLWLMYCVVRTLTRRYATKKKSVMSLFSSRFSVSAI